MHDGTPISVRLGGEPGAHVRLEILGYEHPEVAEPHGLDLLACRICAAAPPVQADFTYALRLQELSELREYFAEINSGNGPQGTFAFAGGLFNLTFAPSRRGPILCAVLLKSIDATHLRLEFMVTLEPNDISQALTALSNLD